MQNKAFRDNHGQGIENRHKDEAVEGCPMDVIAFYEGDDGMLAYACRRDRSYLKLVDRLMLIHYVEDTHR